SALRLFLDGGALHFLDRARAQPEFFLALARDRSARRPRVSLQIHECLRAALDRAGARARPAVAPRIQTARRLSAPRGVRALLSFNKQAAPNWDVLAFVSFGILAAAYWQERLAAKPVVRLAAAVAIFLGLAMSVLALDTDILRSAGIRIPRRDPADRMRGWKSAAGALENLRANLEKKIGEPLFLIADQRDLASELSFYLRNKRVEGPGHPPVYIVESQDIVNQFSFWPRYDEFVEVPLDAPRPDGEVYTEESGINPFTGRSALYIQ